MATKIGIYGFGRIGGWFFRASRGEGRRHQRPVHRRQVYGIHAQVRLRTWAIKGSAKANGKQLLVNGHAIDVYAAKRPEDPVGGAALSILSSPVGSILPSERPAPI